MYFTNWAVRSATNRLQQLGLQACPICAGETLTARNQPSILRVGGTGDPETKHPDENILFLFHLSCSLCGYVMLFDAERHDHGDVPTLTAVPPAEQPPEADMDPRDWPEDFDRRTFGS